MRKFEIWRYFRRFFALVLLITLAGTAGVYAYCLKKQTYVATTRIKYLHDGIQSGLAPDGTPMDVNEIYSPTVISRAMDDIGDSDGLSRSRCSVEKVVSEEQQLLTESQIKKGEEATYFPDEYEVRLTVDGAQGSDFARQALEAIISSYCSLYTQKHVELPLSLNPSSGLLEKGYDYYECVDVLAQDTADVLNYLADKKENYPDFRSAATGYSYSDLYDIYKMLDDYAVPSLYARVMDGPLVRNADSLCKSLADQIALSEQQESVYTTRQDYLLKLINTYSEKNKEIIEYHYHTDSTNGNDYILKQVESYGDGENREITYDSLILESVQIDQSLQTGRIDRSYKQRLLTAFQSAVSPADAQACAEMEAAIQRYETSLSDFYALVRQTSLEHNQTLSANYIKTTSSVRVSQSIQTPLYCVIGFLFFLLAGCGIAVAMGRTHDLVEYFTYVDKKTGLPNRDRIDQLVEELSSRLLPDQYACLMFRMVNLSDLTKQYGHYVGDRVLQDFAGILHSLEKEGGFIGYNGAGQFVALFENCNDQKVQAVLRLLAQRVEEYNRLNPDYAIAYKADYAVSTMEQKYKIRDLLQTAACKTEQGPVQGAAL